jgi:hypothetical protein
MYPVLRPPDDSCCCGHSAKLHLGGPDLDQSALEALHLAKPGGDGGMCRARIPGTIAGRCECFNLCDCHMSAEGADA